MKQHLNTEISCETLIKFLISIGFNFTSLDKKQVLIKSRKKLGRQYKLAEEINFMQQKSLSIIYTDET